MVHRTSPREFFKQESTYFLAVIMGIFLLVSHYLYWRVGGNIYYAAYFIPLLVFAVAVGISRFATEKKAWASIFIAGILLNGSINVFQVDIVSNPFSETDLARVKRGASLIERHTKPSDTVVAFDNSIFHVYASGRKTKPPLINRNFLYTPHISRAVAEPLLIYNFDLLSEWIREADFFVYHQERGFKVLTDEDLQDSTGQDKVAEIKKILQDQYILVDSAYNVYPRKYTVKEDGGTLLLYKNLHDNDF